MEHRPIIARATGISVRTLQEWEQGRKVPSSATQSLLKLVSRHIFGHTRPTV